MVLTIILVYAISTIIVDIIVILANRPYKGSTCSETSVYAAPDNQTCYFFNQDPVCCGRNNYTLCCPSTAPKCIFSHEANARDGGLACCKENGVVWNGNWIDCDPPQTFWAPDKEPEWHEDVKQSMTTVSICMIAPVSTFAVIWISCKFGRTKPNKSPLYVELNEGSTESTLPLEESSPENSTSEEK